MTGTRRTVKSNRSKAALPVLRLRRGCVAAGAVGQHPGDRQAADPHLRRHARVVRRDPGRRAALHMYYPFKGNRPEILFDPYTSRSTTSRRHNHLGRHRAPLSYEP